MENVRGLHSMPIVPKVSHKANPEVPVEWMEKGSLLRDILARFEKIGYRVDCFLVNVVNYWAVLRFARGSSVLAIDSTSALPSRPRSTATDE